MMTWLKPKCPTPEQGALADGARLSSQHTLIPASPEHNATAPDTKEAADAAGIAPAATAPSIPSTEQSDGFEEYPAAWKLVAILIGLSLTVFLVSLDNTILATAVPKITEQFNSLDDVGWYGSSFMLTNCAVSLLYGKLYSFFSIKWVFLAALAVFEIGSLVCGIAPNSVALIIGRAVAGLGGAGLFSGSILLVAQSVPKRQRALCTGIVSSLYAIAGVAGPLMGGALTDYVSWRWCFYINLPLGAVTFVFVVFFFKAQRAIKSTTGLPEKLLQLNPLSMALFLPAVICLLLALQWGGAKYPWSDGRVIALFVVFGVLLLLFVGLQWWQQEDATIPPHLIRNRNVWGSSLYTFSLTGSFMVFTYYLPIWFQSIKGVSATQSGILNLPMLAGVGVCSVIAGAIVTAFGQYMPFVYFAPVATSIAGGLLCTLQVDTGRSAYLGYQALYGIGFGAGMTQPMMAVQAALPATDTPTGIVIVMFTQTIGGALFISVAQNLFQNKLLENLAGLGADVDVEKVVSAGATSLRRVVSADLLPAVLREYSAAVTFSFYLATALAALAIFGTLPMQWLSLKKSESVQPAH
ncbi:major facilitator superfamily domain-containing protein [Aspergillus carlsbadensis]|nr:major facilitator superfamily domain-containing protein [Aspergillus carlsbadensis]